ncbi:MAG: beta-ketoacyl-ACP reductase [Saprospiraceae bacterium]|jgi:3-oxoacyl-[acyl-carrier protein] reductase|uniref:Beta-ketoacyl-ACP reductase n=1 Tax=Candidatus Defluviibacterium haderslevense TaxID=2981993 RepID=A0A9D7SAU7_9BACT|nr:beta-ketoacyl-ACP reductase [Candidatus Defluviibacterium haderslevense]MBK9718056.1 beta-ketoacyl-ACP reductase [Candidatus Defluviibacterium haderslevense]MBL0237033.1 beta-ketoacyl-ACP reductase [Candidatus Defluviibacterium haderslevense]MCC7026307.1 beta-ketoacyl-ACP reductase [Saprospiraceae bacterium]HRI35192.1 beta-ketoacyl-ACP reductase [Saprospiraceae bacterium]
MKKLLNKIAVITGGASGIGKATVKTFLDQGAKVAIWDISYDRAMQLKTELNRPDEDIKVYKVNAGDFQAVSEAALKTKQDFGRIDILVNNAGITKDSSLLKMTPEQWQQVIDINLTGVFNCTRAIAPFMVEQLSGRILNASSVVGKNGNFGQTNYAASKAGVIAMTQTWAKELGRKGITVNAVAPGFIATEMVQAMPPEVVANMKSKVPSQRLGLPEEIGALYAFLASDDAAYINGATISIDGGISL